MSQAEAAFDIVVIGAGPVGLTAASLALAYGMTVLVVEKEARPYALPRAIHFNGDVLRIFQTAGVAEMVRPQIGVQRGTTIYGADGALNVRLSFAEDDSTGWNRQYCFYQPLLEATLRDNLIGRPGCALLYGCDAGIADQDDTGATVRYMQDGIEKIVRAGYVVACDGARSPARTRLGIEMDDLDEPQNWAVVDCFIEAPCELPSDRTVIRSDPSHPAVYVPGPGPHRRFEWQLAPDEDPVDAVSIEGIERAIGQWIDPSQVEIIRHAAYTFRARIARSWRYGRIFLAGDAAHQTPPFLGQGMGHGVRDVANLVWKLAASQHRSAHRLLESYEQERKPHVVDVIGRSIEVGRRMAMRNRAAAAERDQRVRAAGTADRMDADKLMPPITGGLIGDGAAAGSTFPQPFVSLDGRRMRLDDVIGRQSALITRASLPESAAQAVARAGLHSLSLADAAVDTPLVAWLDQHDSDFVIVRPDRHVYSHGRSCDVEAAIRDYADVVSAPDAG